ncbi:MAG: molybdopterin-guanine dinucleotide biosynthesis protein [Gemmatimonadetes bacterium]|nr:molybdopterin-guanine dinucleotide biosynthesis protein [Gemmatimonadota bacterium]
MSAAPEVPPAVAIVGRKNSGKTTLVVALAAELRRRGYRIASLKHGHHDFEVDEPGRDTWRHFHEGGVEAVVMASVSKVALVMRLDDGEPDPRDLIRRFYAGRGYDVVLVEGYKRGPFPRIEVFRRGVHDHPLYDPAASSRRSMSADADLPRTDGADSDSAGGCIATVTDGAGFHAPWPVFALDADDPLAGAHVGEVADLIERRFLGGRDGG